MREYATRLLACLAAATFGGNMKFEIQYTDDAFEDLPHFRKYDQVMLLDQVERQLTYEPTVETRGSSLFSMEYWHRTSEAPRVRVAGEVPVGVNTRTSVPTPINIDCFGGPTRTTTRTRPVGTRTVERIPTAAFAGHSTENSEEPTNFT